MMTTFAKTCSRTGVTQTQTCARSLFANSKRTFAASSSSEALVQTALYDMHKELGGDMVPFAGYELPVLYKGENGGVMKEHLWCRADNKSALFDVSHMGQVRLIREPLCIFKPPVLVYLVT